MVQNIINILSIIGKKEVREMGEIKFITMFILKKNHKKTLTNKFINVLLNSKIYLL